MLVHSLGRSCIRWAAPSVLLAAAVSLVPTPARACSWAQVVIESSYPAPDAVDVPTNAVLFVYGPALTATDSVQLVDDRGAVVPVEVRAALPSGLDVTPLEELRAERRYVLRTVGPNASGSVAFTTGDGPAPVPESLSAPELDVVQFSYSLGSCGVLAGLCLETSSAADTTLEVRVGTEVLALGAAGPVSPPGARQPFSRAYAQALSDGDCVEVRARDVRGHRSESRTLCGDAIARFELRGNNFETAYTCDNYLDFTSAAATDPEPEPTTPEVVSPVVSGPPRPENASSPRDVTYVADSVDMRNLTDSDTVIYDEVPPARSSNGCALGSPGAARSGPGWSGPGRFGLGWLGLAIAALLGARRRS